jgi:biopolymer transport protein ExbB
MSTVATMTLLARQDAGAGMTWWETIQAGGVVGYVIIGLSVVSLALVIMHLAQIRRKALIPPVQLQEIDQLLVGGDVAGALQYCMDPEADSYLTRVLSAGLTRYQKSAFGAFEIKTAIEEAIEDQTARLYRSTDALGVIGSIAPLLGLLGTVLGMIGAFGTISATATPDHEELASNISLALVTTLMGLIVAIPCVALYKFFGNRIDAFASEAALEIERLALHLESSGIGAAAPSPRVRQAQPARVPAQRAAPKPAAPLGGAAASGAAGAAPGGSGAAGGAAQ